MSPTDLFIYSLSLITAMQALVTAVLLRLHGRDGGIAGWAGPAAFALLAFLLVGEAIERLGLHRSIPILGGLLIVAPFLLGPAVYAFVRVVSPFAHRPSRWWALHLLPAAVAALVFLPLFLPKTEATNPALARLYPFMWRALALQLGVYLALSVVLIFRDVRRLDHALSFRGGGYEARLRRVLVMLALPWTLFAIELVLEMLFRLPFEAKLALGAMRAGCIFVVALLAVYPHPLVPFAKQPLPDAMPEEPENDPEKPRYARSALDDASAERIAARIRAAMETDTLFKNPFLTLQELSAHLAVPAHKLSQTLNVHMGRTFFDMVNEYRVRYVEAAFKEGSGATVLELANEAGFNSKSTFNAAFKKVTGETPTAYRKRVTERE